MVFEPPLFCLGAISEAKRSALVADNGDVSMAPTAAVGFGPVLAAASARTAATRALARSRPIRSRARRMSREMGRPPRPGTATTAAGRPSTTSASVPTSPRPAGPAGKPTPAPRSRRQARPRDTAHGHRPWSRDGPPATPRAATGHAPFLPPIRSRGQASARDRKPAMNCGNIGVRSVNGACSWMQLVPFGAPASRTSPHDPATRHGLEGEHTDGGLPCSSGDERGDDAGPVARLLSLAKIVTERV